MAANKIHRIFALTLLALILLPLFACAKPQAQTPDPDPPGQEQPGTSSPAPPDGGTPPAQTPGEPPAPPTVPDPPLPEPPARSGIVWEIDLGFLEQNNYALDVTFLCGDDTVLLFASPMSPDGTLHEKSVVFSYSLLTGRVYERALDLDLVGFYPTCVYDDGTVSIVTLDSETYEYKAVVFIDPLTLETNTVPLTGAENMMGLCISFDKRYAALSTFDGLFVYDLGLSQLYYSIERQPGEDESGVDDRLAMASGWSADSSVLSVQYIGLQWALYPALLHISDWRLEEFEHLASKELCFLDASRMLCYEWYAFFPVELFDRATGSLAPFRFEEHLSDVEVMTFALSQSGRYIGLSYTSAAQNDEPQRTALVADSKTGQTVYTFSLPGLDAHYIFFEQLFFTADERTMVLTSSSVIDVPKRVYICDFGW